MITVHGRTRDQMFKGTADWQAIRAVKDSVKIPVIVNGDITSPQEAAHAMELSGADGVMIGRGCYGRPWLLRQIMDYLRDGTITAAPEMDEISNLVQEHYDAMLHYYGEHKGIGLARKHLLWYLENLPGAQAAATTIKTLQDPAAVKEKLSHYFAAAPQGAMIQ